MKTEQSKELFQKAKKLMPGGVNSPVRAFKSVEGDPLFIERGDGAYIWDADGNKYLDFCGSWGPLILGHNHPAVREAAIKAIEKGTTFGAPTREENELAELIITNHRYIEKIRFVSSGTEAVMSALRLARGVTGKNKIIKFDGCYHGHCDAMLVKAGSGLITFGSSSSGGVPENVAQDTIVVSLNNLYAVEKVFEEFANEIACVIIEPVPANNGLLIQEKSFLNYLREVTENYNSLLIFDEVISGFRIGFEGAAGYYNIQPDIITFGKIIGGGFPVGAYAANTELMSHIAPEGGVYQAGTLSGNPVAMAAGIAQLKECLKNNFYSNLENISKVFVAKVNEFAAAEKLPFHIFNMGSVFWPAFTEKEKISSAEEIDASSMSHFKILHKELLEQGIYLGPSGYEVGFVSSAHNFEDLIQSSGKFINCLEKVFTAKKNS
jgi:glutamate-1-semialdehyde 2,1-aminomutase